MKRDAANKTYLYICNQKRCDNCSAVSGLCRHTSDISYAAHYVHGSQIDDDNFVEVAPDILMEKDHEERSMEKTNKERLH